MVDAADRDKIEASSNELHNLLDKPQLQGIPVRTEAHHHSKLNSQSDCSFIHSSLVPQQCLYKL